MGLVRAGGRRILLVLETMRPKQWIKNGFVLGGLLFAGRVLEVDALARALTVFLAFCALSGAMYLVNDAADAETDRLNARTARRPIARGALPGHIAVEASVLIVAAALVTTALVNVQTLLVAIGFCVLQAAYSLALRRLFLVDVMAIAAGFVLRALAGLVAIDAYLSPWLLLATGLLALFLGLTKRRSEVLIRGASAPGQRAVLTDYTVPMLDQLIAVVTPTILVVYAIYGVLGAQTQLMLLTLPFVLYGIFRVLYLIHRHAALTEDPSAIVWRDRPLLVCIALWGISAGSISIAVV